MTGGSGEHYSSVDHPDQRDFMSPALLAAWNGGKYARGMDRRKKEKIAEKAKVARTTAASARDRLGDYLTKQFTLAEQGSSSSETDTSESYDELTDADFGVDPSAGKPGAPRKPGGDGDDEDYTPIL
jgi:hypothetical protein